MSMLNEKKELSIVVINSRFIFSNALHVCRNVLFLWWYLNRLKMELMKPVVTTTGRLKRVTVTLYLLLLDEMPTNIAHTKTGIKHKSKVSIIILVVFEALQSWKRPAVKLAPIGFDSHNDGTRSKPKYDSKSSRAR